MCLLIMNQLDLLTKSYGKLHYYPHIPFWLLTPLRKVLRIISSNVLPKYLSGSNYKAGEETDVIVSFTSFPARIGTVWQVVECMMRQSFQPKKIILWLSKEQFKSEDSIPESLLKRTSEIFEIRFVDGDIRSHKKYYYVSKEYPNSLIFLIDDDIYYPTDILERSIKAREEYPDCVICNYGYHIGKKFDDTLKPYNTWEHEHSMSISEDLFFGSGGGTLFKPSDLYKDLTDIETARLLCPLADDIWLNAMVRLAMRKMVLLKNGLILSIKIKNNITLKSQNKTESKNDEQLANIIEFYNKKGISVF